MKNIVATKHKIACLASYLRRHLLKRSSIVFLAGLALCTHPFVSQSQVVKLRSSDIKHQVAKQNLISQNKLNLTRPSVQAAAATGQQIEGIPQSVVSSGQATMSTAILQPHLAQGPINSKPPSQRHHQEEDEEKERRPDVPIGELSPDIPPPTEAMIESVTLDNSLLRGSNSNLPQAPNDFKYQVVHNITASEVGGSRSNIQEPSVGNMGNTVFMTANWYAARSTDAGNSFAFVSPVSTFTSINGGFCCDQIVNYAPNQNMMLWGLQYRKDSNTGTFRLARAVGSTAVANNTWTFYDFNPQFFGFPNGNWMDFPNLTVASNYLYCSSNVYRTSDDGASGAVVWRIPLAQLAAGGTISVDSFREPTMNGFRCTEGATTTMYFALQLSTTRLRIFHMDDSSTTVSWDDVNFSGYTRLNRDGVATSPDGTNWAARADDRILGAWVAQGVIGFMWGAKQGGTKPYPYTVIARFNQSNRAFINQFDIFSNNNAWLYPTVSVNSSGNLAGMLMYGGGSLYPGANIWVVDDVQNSFNPLALYGATGGTRGPSDNLWGDYHTIRPHKDFPRSWVSISYQLPGGASGSTPVPTYLWFGRERDLPSGITTRTLTVASSTPSSGVSITVSPNDNNGQGSGVTQFSRTYNNNTSVTLTAPSSAGGNNFQKWQRDGADFAFNQSTTLTMDANHTMTAVYGAVTRTLTVSSSPSSGVSITVSPNDNNGQGGGVTQFTRTYNNNVNVSLTAPASAGGNTFVKWQRNSVDFAFNQSTSVTMDANYTMTAVYGTPQAQYQGFLDAAGCGIITGWAWNANLPNTVINVDIFDGTTFIISIPANLFREDIVNAGIGNGFHGFSFTVPSSLKNGQPHNIRAFFGGTSTELNNSPRTITCNGTAPLYQGFHDGAGCNTISGWAWDANDPDNPINVDIYDGSTLIARVPAIQFRPDLVTAGIGNGFHGFSFTVPASLKDGQVHSIRVKFPQTNIDLGNTPRAISCNGGAPIFQGLHEVANCSVISGWAWDTRDPNSPINVAIFSDGQLIATVLAIQFRQDLVNQGIGNGYHAFTFNVPANLKDGQPHSIRVRFSGSTTDLGSTPRTLTCSSSQQLLSNPGFEQGPAIWGATANVITNDPGRDAHGGSWKAWLCGFGETHTDTLAQNVTIPSSAGSATLTFWLHIDTQEGSTTTAFDTLKVQIRNSAGTVVLTTLATYSNLNSATGYSLKSFDLSSFRGQAIMVYFEGVEDSSLQTSFVVDDTALTLQ